jgi:hypothetical protein
MPALIDLPNLPKPKQKESKDYLTREMHHKLAKLDEDTNFPNFEALQEFLGLDLVTMSTNSKQALFKEIGKYCEVLKVKLGRTQSYILRPLTMEDLYLPVANYNQTEQTVNGGILLLFELSNALENYRMFRDAHLEDGIDRLGLYNGRCSLLDSTDPNSLICVTFKKSEIYMLCNWTTRSYYKARSEYLNNYRELKVSKESVGFYNGFFSKVVANIASNTLGVFRLFKRYPMLGLDDTYNASVVGVGNRLLSYKDTKLLENCISLVQASGKYQRFPVQGYGKDYYDAVCKEYNSSIVAKDSKELESFSKSCTFVLSERSLNAVIARFYRDIGLTDDYRKGTVVALHRNFEAFMKEQTRILEGRMDELAGSVGSRFDVGLKEVEKLDGTLEACKGWLEYIWSLE